MTTQAEAPRIFAHMDAIIDANKAHGHHFFDADTRRFFRARLTSRVYPSFTKGGAYFVHSIQFTDRDYTAPRQYLVGYANPDGSIDNVTGKEPGQGFATIRQADYHARLLRARAAGIADPD